MDEIQRMIQVLADPKRFEVFACIRGCGGVTTRPANGEPVAVGEACCEICCAPSTLSYHLAELREAGLITTEKRGRRVYAAVVPEALDKLATFFSVAQPCCCEPVREHPTGGSHARQPLPVLQR